MRVGYFSIRANPGMVGGSHCVELGTGTLLLLERERERNLIPHLGQSMAFFLTATLLSG